MRDHHILSYAEYLHSDPALWRIAVDYMYSCGDVGKQQADEVLLRVPLRLQEQRTSDTDRSTTQPGDVVGVLKDVNETCLQYGREFVRRTVCRVSSSSLLAFGSTHNSLLQIAAQSLVKEKDYALAVAYCISAEDWPGLGRVVDRVLDEYFNGWTSCLVLIPSQSLMSVYKAL